MSWSVAAFENAQAVIRRVSFPGLRFGIRPHCSAKMVIDDLGRSIEHPDPSQRLTVNEVDIRVECPEGVCNVTGQPGHWTGRWWRLSQHMTDGEIVQTCFKAVMTAMEHEIRENFKYRDVSVFDPHYDIDALVALRQTEGGGLKEREHHA